jgi:hypothetical protein
MPSNAVGLFAFVFLFILTGCGKSATPIVETTPIAVEERMTVSATPIVEATPTGLEARMTESAPHVSPYIDVMVVNVEIRYLETNPAQIELVIHGTLPDQCKYDFYSIENRANQNVKITLDGIHPADISCLQTNQSIEYVLRLGRDMPESERGFAPGDYELKVNNYQTTFSIK